VFQIQNVYNLRDGVLCACGVAARALLLCTLLSPHALAQRPDTHEQHAVAAREGQTQPAPATGKPGVIEVGPVKFEIPDVEVLDQDGRKVRFYSDLIKGKVVVVSFFFTSCKLVCPMQGRVLTKLQSQLAARLGKEVFFISVSKDPQADTPQRLKRWGGEFAAGRGWTFVTGAEGVMKKLLWKFTGETPGPQLHTPIILIGNDRTGVWTEADGLDATEELVKIVNQVSGSVVVSKR
jgi:cytochrome oxidase Cu insertion factor (SCO1/SenC/PrrC family)